VAPNVFKQCHRRLIPREQFVWNQPGSSSLHDDASTGEEPGADTSAVESVRAPTSTGRTLASDRPSR